ncbi:MAG TPA: LamG-like jellyroll fold domain-containing protein, partial [Planctomycetota bacterium]|nr:LamG-like jellyroll fold domain-containing protein [Planctomycetota bacterium]
LLTFRSAAAGFYDLASVGGTGNLGGFRSGCTSNLIPAGGVIAAPDYTRDCTCAYQNQASLALVPMPEVEMWTFTSFDSDRQPVDHVGINFGAPGDRRADDGTLWLDWPSRGGKSPDLNVVVSKELESSSVRYHASRVAGGAAPEWVGASGLVGAGEIRIEVIPAGDEIAVPNEITTGKTLVAKRGRLSPSRPFAVHPDGSRNHHVLAVADKKDFDARIEKDPTLATESITVELWLRSDHDDPTWIDARGKPAEGEEQPKSGFVLRERDLELVYWLRKPDGTIESVELEGSKSIEKNRWYHVAWTYDATTGRGELFLDGERIDETEIDAGSVLHWGDEPADWRLLPSPSDRAALDELRVASRALPVDEFLPRAERAPEGIVGHWRMDARTSKEGMLSFSYSVRLIFAELDERGPGERVFDVVVNDVHRLEGIDPARAAGGPYRTWVEELRGVT